MTAASNAILNAAIARLADFRENWDDGHEICEQSGLTAADLDIILTQLTWFPTEPANPVMAEIRVGGE